MDWIGRNGCQIQFLYSLVVDRGTFVSDVARSCHDRLTYSNELPCSDSRRDGSSGEGRIRY